MFTSSVTPPCDAVGRQPRPQDEHDQHQRRAPGLFDQFLERLAGVIEQELRQRPDRLHRRAGQVVAPECREQQRRRLARHPRQCEKHPGQHRRHRGAEDDPQHDPAPRQAKSEPRLVHALGDCTQRLFGRPREDRQHDDRQRQPAGEHRESRPDGEAGFAYDDRVHEDADDDRGDAAHHVQKQASRLRQFGVTLLCEVDAFGKSDGDREDASDDEQREGSEDRVDDAAFLSDRLPGAEEKAEADHLPAVGDQRVEEARQRNHAQHHAQPHEGENASADPSSPGGSRHAAAPATCFRTISRAAMFRANVTRNSSNAISMSDAVNKSLGASAN
jgi:hypothetical protein